MGIFSRLGSLIKSNLNDLISKSEDPEKMLNQVVLDMKNQLVEAKKQVAVAIGDEKRLKRQWDESINTAKEWERKAMLAVNAGDDALAKEALMRQKEFDDYARQYEQQWTQQKDAVEKLKDQLRNLNNKIDEAQRKKNILIARAKRAEAQKTIQQTMSGLSDTSAFDTFDRMSDKVGRLEAEAEASYEVANELTGDALEAKFKKLETSSTSTSADMALAELKAKMGLPPASTNRALGAGEENSPVRGALSEAKADKK